MTLKADDRCKWPFVAEIATVPVVYLELGGKMVQVLELKNSAPTTMLVSSDMFEAMLKELRNGKVASKEV
jgi:hypothetical protein